MHTGEIAVAGATFVIYFSVAKSERLASRELAYFDHESQMGSTVTTGELTRGDLLTKITGVLADVIDDPSLSLSETTTADQVGEWDSINHVKLLIGLESELGFRFETNEVAGLRRVGDLIDLIQKKLSQRKL